MKINLQFSGLLFDNFSPLNNKEMGIDLNF